MGQAPWSTIRTRLLKIGARIRVTVRRVWGAMAQACPYLRRVVPPRGRQLAVTADSLSHGILLVVIELAAALGATPNVAPVASTPLICPTST